MWVAPDDRDTLEEGLFRFMLSVRDGRPRADRPLLAPDDVLRAVCEEPNPQLAEVLCHCLDAFLVRLSPDAGRWGELKLHPSALYLGMALNNCLVRGAPNREAEDFTARLIKALPPARQFSDALAYHSLLRGSEKFLATAEPWRAAYLQNLVDRSPLTTLWALGEHTPPGLSAVARDLLSPRRVKEIFRRGMGETGWSGAGEWLRTLISLLADPHIAKWVRHRWLAMPTGLRSCRNVGLLIEVLRRRGDPGLRDFILSFYESYDHFRGETGTDEWGRRTRVWRELATIGKMLMVPGDSDAAIEMGRRGGEYFLKFRPLVQLVIAEGGLPKDYMRLSTDFIVTLRSLLRYVGDAAPRGINFKEVSFISQS
ncbi:MAG: hypothetical protein ABW208_20790 [Pyrinomonadaceae bacterium]